MQHMMRMAGLAAAGAISVAGCASMQPGPKDMTFFVTSVGSGKGGDLGGLDSHVLHADGTYKFRLPRGFRAAVMLAEGRVGNGEW
jgi:hypothetical protein